MWSVAFVDSVTSKFPSALQEGVAGYYKGRLGMAKQEQSVMSVVEQRVELFYKGFLSLLHGGEWD